MCIHTTTIFTCGHKLHRRESTVPECVLGIHDTPPVEENRNENCSYCNLKAASQVPEAQQSDKEQAPKKRKGLLTRALSVVSGVKAREKAERKEAERLSGWHDFLNSNTPRTDLPVNPHLPVN